MMSTSIRYPNPTVVAFTGTARNATNVSAAIAAKQISIRKKR
jgi:hypothetical protein